MSSVPFLEQAALSGFQQGSARKDQLADEERQMKAGPLIETSKALIAKLPNLTGPDLDAAKQQLAETQAAFDELYHPIKAPGAIQRDAHFLLSKIKSIHAPKDTTPSSTTSQTPAMAIPSATGPITIPELPAYQQVTPRMPSQGGSITTQVPAVPATTVQPMTAIPKGATPTMAVANPKGLVEAGNIPIWNRPSVLNADGTHSSELSISMKDDKGNEVLIPLIVDGKFLTPDGKMPSGPIPHNAQEWEKASPEWKALRMQAWQHYEQTGQHLGKFDNPDDTDAYAQVLHNRGSATANAIPAGPPVTVTKAPAPTWGQAQVLKQKAAAMQKAQQEAGLLAAGAPLSPGQQGQAEATQQAAARWAGLRADIANWDKDNPTASKEDKDAIYQQLYSKWVGTTGRGNWETVTGTVADPSDPSKRNPVSYSFDKASNRLTDFNGTPVNPEIASTFIPDPKASGTAAQDLKDYQNDPDPNKGTFASWKVKQTTAGKGLVWDTATGQVKGGPNGRRYNAWDADAPQDVKDMFRAQGIMLDKKQQMAMALAAARGASFAQNRIVMVSDPRDPASSVYMPAGLAYKLGFKAPSGAYYQAMEKMLSDATSGPIANEFTAFGTALQHADLLQRAALGLSNGDSRLVNSITNDFSVAFGDPSVTNFDVVRGAYQRELTKALTTGHITDSEIAQNGLALPDNASPAQIQGAISNYKALMNSKIAVRIPQIQSALGRFGIPTPFTPPGYTPPAGSPSVKKKVSIAKAKLKPQNKGKTDDQIKADIDSHGYEATP